MVEVPPPADIGSGRKSHSDLVPRWLFLKLLGGVYFVAFVSIGVQIQGLIGSHGILPASEYLDNARQQLGSRCYFQLPTVCWLNCSDAALTTLWVTGCVLSLLLIASVAPLPVLILLWATYLSLSVVGQTFLSFQWDTLLLETGFFAILWAPWTLSPRSAMHHPTSPLARWLLWWLLFKLMFLSGATKLLSGDPTWRDLTAMNFHYETQPIPSWVSWYMHQLPQWWHKTSVLMTFAVELIVPFLVFGPRLGRIAAALILAALQVLIEVTGNFGFFNLLSIVLCVPLLDDQFLLWLVRRRWRPASVTIADPVSKPRWKTIGMIVPLAILFLASLLTFVREMVRSQDQAKLPRSISFTLQAADDYVLRWAEPFLDWIDPLRTINGYGLFRVMTTERPEIVIEGSQDGLEWIEYQFRWKPGDLKRAPPIVAPHQPRLDWQMWFAALNPRGSQHWLAPFAKRLLTNEPTVIGLLAENPFPDASPRYVRFVYYRYQFTTYPERRATGQWWQRTKLGELTRPLSLDRDFGS